MPHTFVTYVKTSVQVSSTTYKANYFHRVSNRRGCVKTLNYKKQASLYADIKPYSEALFFHSKVEL